MTTKELRKYIEAIVNQKYMEMMRLDKIENKDIYTALKVELANAEYKAFLAVDFALNGNPDMLNSYLTNRIAEE